MNKPAHAAREPACEIRFGQVGLTQIRVQTTDVHTLHDELAARMSAAPQLFARSGVCLDLNAFEQVPQASDVRALLQVIRSADMLPIGLAQGTDSIEELARALDLPVLVPRRAQSKVTPEVQSTAAERPLARRSTHPAAAAAEAVSSALVHSHPVRSGQRVYARNRDLIVTTPVGAGAEVMADGCVHVYGVLRGRALAGARGETAARVFCQEFRAELVSIAGVFRVFETLPPELAGKPVQAWLDGDDLHFAALA